MTTFQSVATGRLRRRGIRGLALVTLDGGALEIRGTEGGALRLGPSRVARVRAGWEATKGGPHYEARLWIDDARPLVLHANRASAVPYAQVMRGFAAAMAEAGLLHRLERGTSAFSALFMPVLMGILLLVASGISVFALDEALWWQRLFPPAVPAVLTAVGVLLARRNWPRRVRTLDEFLRAVA